MPDSNWNKSFQGGNRIVFKLNDRNFKSKSKYEENNFLQHVLFRTKQRYIINLTYGEKK